MDQPLYQLGIPVAVLFLLILAGMSIRMIRTTGLEDVESDYVVTENTDRSPSLMSRLIDALGARFERTLLQLSGQRRLRYLERTLDHAGHPEGLTARAFVRRQAGMGALGILAGTFFFLGGQTPLAVLVIVMLCGWMDVWIRSASRKRQATIARELPDFLDVLAVTVAAGLSLRAALERVSGSADSPLGQEIRRMLDDMQLGMSRREALEHLRQRNSVESVDSWVSAMLQAEELGAPLSETLREIAKEVRRSRAAAVRRIAAKATPKIGMVVSMVIVPGALLLIVASLLIAQLDNLSAVFGG